MYDSARNDNRWRDAYCIFLDLPHPSAWRPLYRILTPRKIKTDSNSKGQFPWRQLWAAPKTTERVQNLPLQAKHSRVQILPQRRRFWRRLAGWRHASSRPRGSWGWRMAFGRWCRERPGRTFVSGRAVRHPEVSRLKKLFECLVNDQRVRICSAIIIMLVSKQCFVA